MASEGVEAPPIIDFGPFYSNNVEAKQKLVQQVRAACLAKGFFQIINHGVPRELQQLIFTQCQEFFALPIEEKLKCDKTSNPYNKGYEALRTQNFEQGAQGDLKEGFYFGRDLPLSHPAVISGKFNMGPNTYPLGVSDPDLFRSTMDKYLNAMITLVQDVLEVLALTLDLPEDYFATFVQDPIATLRLLHYPPQEPTADPSERGIGAHTDFGAVTLLLQDDVGGLQVYDKPSNSWIDVVPTPNAYVVNLGNLMMRWSNDQYISNLHRVINKSGQERYSIPFFFPGNPDFLVTCLPGCEGDEGPKYGPIKVEDWMRGRYASTYGGDPDLAVADPVSETKA